VLKLAEELGASTAVLSSEDVAQALILHAQSLNCASLIVGRPHHLGWNWIRRLYQPTLIHQLAVLAPSMDFIEVGISESVRKLPPKLPRQLPDDVEGTRLIDNWQYYALSAGACLLTTLLAFPLAQLFDLANIVMLFLLCVVLVAVKWGRGPSMLAAVVSVGAFDFFFVQPRFSFAVSDVQYLLTFAVMLVVGLLIGQLTANLKYSAQVSATREQRAKALFELTRDLSGALVTSQVVESAELLMRRSFGGDARILLPDAHDQLSFEGAQLPESLDTSIADWSFRNRQRAGVATVTLPSSQWHFVPLQAPMRIRGVLALLPAKPHWLLIPEQIQQLETFARQIAIALERIHYVDVAQTAVVQMESERLRNTLLAAMSHDIRTPLTALTGQAERLATSIPLTDYQRSTAQTISQEARELSTLVTNILEMARLESGQVELRKDWQSIEEVVGSAIRAARHALGILVVKTDLPPDLPLVEFDANLIERVLVNLLENAAKYGVIKTPPNPAILVSAHITVTLLSISVRDFGPGLPTHLKGKSDDLFAKFTRGNSESSTRGMGLGLAICKSIIDAHQGKITAHQATDGGAIFTFTLPRNPPPETA
jgi:two-component system sensor histidine kinase KdpD